MNKKVIDLLNQARERELHAIIQYMIQHYELDNDGYDKLAGRMKAISIQEMKHAEKLGERIMFLGGVPSTKPAADAKKGLDLSGQMKFDEELEAGAIKMYNDSAVICAAEGDQASKQLFEELLADEEAHIDEFQKTLDHIEKLGQAYIATLTG